MPLSTVSAVLSRIGLGTLVVGRQPENALAWIFCALRSFFIALLPDAAEAYFYHAHHTWPAATLLGFISDTGWMIGVGVPARASWGF